MNVEVGRDTGGALVTADGELDLSTAPELFDVAARSVEDHQSGTLQLDLAGVRFIDSSGINTLLEIRELCRSREIPLQIMRVSARVEEVLVLTAVAPLFDIAGT